MPKKAKEQFLDISVALGESTLDSAKQIYIRVWYGRNVHWKRIEKKRKEDRIQELIGCRHNVPLRAKKEWGRKELKYHLIVKWYSPGQSEEGSAWGLAQPRNWLLPSYTLTTAGKKATQKHPILIEYIEKQETVTGAAFHPMSWTQKDLRVANKERWWTKIKNQEVGIKVAFNLSHED